MAYAGGAEGAWTAYDAEGDRMRIGCNIHSTVWPFTSGMSTAEVWGEYWSQFDIGSGDAISDASYTYNSDGSWGPWGVSGSAAPDISGSAGSSGIVTYWHRVTHRISVSPKYGRTLDILVQGTLSGVEKISGKTASLSAWVYLPKKPYHAPYAPTFVSASVDDATNKVYLNISGNQNNALEDRYWATTDFTIWRSDTLQWQESFGLAGSITQVYWIIAPNSYVQMGARAGNDGDGLSSWTYSGAIFSKPATPSGLTATRAQGSTTVNLAWTNNANFADRYRIERSLNGGVWSWLKDVASGATSTTDTVALESTASYRVYVETPAPRKASDLSGTSSIGNGYTSPDAPSSVVLTRIDDTSATIMVAGNQSNPSFDKYWVTIEWQLETDTGSFVAQTAKAGDATSWTVTGLSANHRYRVRARSGNGTGLSAWRNSDFLYTTPDAVSNVVATRTDVTSTVTLTWTNNALWAANYLIERQLDSGTWAVAGSPAATNFTDDTPPTSLTEYRVSALTPAPVRSSVTTASNTLSPVGFDKEKVPGIVDIFLGSTKVYRVMAGDTQIWLG